MLISAKVVKDRKIAGYYSMKDDIINSGAIYTDEPAVIDDNIITTAHYKDMGPWMREVIKNQVIKQFMKIPYVNLNLQWQTEKSLLKLIDKALAEENWVEVTINIFEKKYFQFLSN